MLASVDSCTVTGIDGYIIHVEVDISRGLPAFSIVGLPEISVRESRDRVKTAIRNSGYTFPMDRLVVNLAPADMKKEGTGLDLPVAAGILIACEIIPQKATENHMIIGELSLDGRIKPVRAVLSCVQTARQRGYRAVIVPWENGPEAAMVKGIDILPVKNLSQMVDYFSGFADIPALHMNISDRYDSDEHLYGIDFSEVQGQFQARRALEIAAAGSHNIIMTGPPGSGKSMMAKRLVTILPELTFEESMEVTKIYSVLGLVKDRGNCMLSRPFRSPHHTISDAGLVGGGSRPGPGEISLAHNGVLFLDELPEFKRNVLEVLRQPVEDGKICIARAGANAAYPARFMLVAAMNPCPCGYLSDPDKECNCTPGQIKKYRSKVSGPLLDRIDIQIEVPRISYRELRSKKRPESSAVIRQRVEKARSIQVRRFMKTSVFSNARMNTRHLKQFCPLDDECEKIIERAVDVLGLSPRACHSVIRVARTIADLEEEPAILRPHIAEAISLRSFDRDFSRTI